MEVTAKAQQLLICWEYDQSLMEGPPFSVSSDEVKRHYGKSYNITLMESKNVPGGLKGQCAATENVWMLKNG
jgi:thiopurine S-methyltransferase